MPINVIMPAHMQAFGPGFRCRISSGLSNSPADWTWILTTTGPGGVVIDYNATYRPVSGANWPSPAIGTAGTLDISMALYPAMFVGIHPAAPQGSTCQLGVTYLDSDGNFLTAFRDFVMDNVTGAIRMLWKFPQGTSSPTDLSAVLAAVRNNYHNAP